MKTYVKPTASKSRQLCQRPLNQADNIETTIAGVFEAVQKDGDQALKDLTKQFDGVVLDSLEISQRQLREWAGQTPAELKRAIKAAYANIMAFHAPQTAGLKSIEVETMPGVRCWREARPIDRVGLYIPGGSAPLFSSVLMLGIPAQLAGCQEVVMSTPPQADGTISPAICYAAGLVGITKVLRLGGAQAIAALACGTDSLPKVDKIFGPGNQYVTAAKMYALRLGVAIDMPAGPSELMIIADGSAQADFVAADLLSQAEHGPDSQVVLVCITPALAKSVSTELLKQLETLPRKAIAGRALKNSFCIVFSRVTEAVAFANMYAPEHLILAVASPKKVAQLVSNAGSVFLGNYAAESAGDYASGTNHTLPTNGWARAYSGLSVDSFCKNITFQSITKGGAEALAPTVMSMAKAEGLEAHKRAMEIRL